MHRPTSGLATTLGRIANDRGRRAEQRAHDAMHAHRDDWPAWIEDVRPATEAEDRRGIDLVAQTDVGKLYLQVKCGSYGMKRHRARYPRIPAVAVKRDEGRRLYCRVLDCFAEARRAILEKRG